MLSPTTPPPNQFPKRNHISVSSCNSKIGNIIDPT